MLIPIVGRGYTERSLNLDAQNRVNFYLHGDPEGKFPMVFYPRPGLRLFSAGVPGQKCVRAMLRTNDYCFIVIDNIFYTIDKSGIRVSRGTLNSFTGRISMIVNGYQCLLTDGHSGYIYQYRDVIDGNPTYIWSINTDPEFNNAKPKLLTYQDGYGIFTQPASQKIWRTELNHLESVHATGFTSSSGVPDWTEGAISSHQELWVFNRKTTEVFYNTGDVDNPFQRRQTLLLQYGCLWPYTIAAADNGTLFWLTANDQGDGIVVRAEGYVPKIISTPPISKAISKYNKEDAFSFVFELDTHIFYVLIFPSENNTLVYDVLLDSWAEWKSTITTPTPAGSTIIQGRWRPNCYTQFEGKHLVGDFESGNIYYLDFDYYSDDGDPIIRELTCRHLHKELRRVTFNELQYSFEEGTGLTNGQGNDPQVMFQYSKDNGHSWSNEKWRSIGKTGKYKDRVRWLKLGEARDWVFRVRMSDPVKWVVLGANAFLEVEN